MNTTGYPSCSYNKVAVFCLVPSILINKCKKKSIELILIKAGTKVLFNACELLLVQFQELGKQTGSAFLFLHISPILMKFYPHTHKKNWKGVSHVYWQHTVAATTKNPLPIKTPGTNHTIRFSIAMFGCRASSSPVAVRSLSSAAKTYSQQG